MTTAADPLPEHLTATLTEQPQHVAMDTCTYSPEQYTSLADIIDLWDGHWQAEFFDTRARLARETMDTPLSRDAANTAIGHMCMIADRARSAAFHGGIPFPTTLYDGHADVSGIDKCELLSLLLDIATYSARLQALFNAVEDLLPSHADWDLLNEALNTIHDVCRQTTMTTRMVFSFA